MKLFDEELLLKNKKMIIVLIISLGLLILLEASYDFISTLFRISKPHLHSLVISEIMTSNQGSFADPYGDCYDWIELYNGTNKDIFLGGYTLSDEEYGNKSWVFPDVTIPTKERLIIYLTGLTLKDKEGMYASFALNKRGNETLLLRDPNGSIVDKVSLKSMPKNSVYVRDDYGNFSISKEITPGYSNDEHGRKLYLESLREESSDLVITEFLPNNKGIYVYDGKLLPYIEVQNQGENPILLSDYYLSDSLLKPYLWNLPRIELLPGEYYLIYPTGLGKENYSSFSINKKEGELLLSRKNKIIETVSYHVTQEGSAFSKNDNGEFEEIFDITPGYSNTLEGRQLYSKTETIPKDLIISEVMSRNHTYLKQKNGNYYDWIELYNNSDQVISLKEYTISTNQNGKGGTILPNRELKPGQYFIIIASGDSTLSNSSFFHAGFTISSSESLYLYKNDTLVDSLYFVNVPNGYSYGRNLKGGHYYYRTPTPNKTNGSGILQISSPPSFRENPGVYQDVDKVSVELVGKGTIYYTLDGSIPTKNSKVYKEPIQLSKTTVIRVIAYEEGKQESSVATGSYIINENHTLPVLSLSLPNNSFQKVNNNPASTTIVVPTHAELFEKDSSFSVDCGLKLFGGESRNLDKKSYALKFSSKYGVPGLKYPVFENRNIEEYDTLVLRSGSQDMSGSMLRDELATSIMVDYGNVDAQSYKPIILYVNGNYWGIYYIREKIDDDFIEQHYDVSKNGTNIVRLEGTVDEGNARDFNSLIQYVKTHDLSEEEHYKYVQSKLDIDNYIEFLIGQFYTNNIDVRNTRFFNNPAISNNKMRMIFYDFDYGFRSAPVHFLPWLLNSEGTGYFKVDNSLIRGLMSNKSFQERFLELLFYNLKYVWSTENVLSRYQEIYSAIAPEMKRNQERWGFSYENWVANCKSIQKFILSREASILRQVKSYFHLTEEEVKQRMKKNHRLKDVLDRNGILNNN